MYIVRDAYIILCHHSPWQVNELAGYLSAAGHDVYIHVDAASKIAGLIEIGERVKLVQRREKVVWADWSVVRATLNAIEAMPQCGRGYRYVHLLSGQCLPAMPLKKLDEILVMIQKIEAGNRLLMALEQAQKEQDYLGEQKAAFE